MYLDRDEAMRTPEADSLHNPESAVAIAIGAAYLTTNGKDWVDGGRAWRPSNCFGGISDLSLAQFLINTVVLGCFGGASIRQRTVEDSIRRGKQPAGASG